MLEKVVYKPLTLPSNRSFGWFFACVFAALGAYAFWKAWSKVSAAAFVLGVLFAAVTLVVPQQLSPLNRLWYGLGLLLGKIVSPIVLGIIFFILITPISLITRLFGRDELKIKKRSVDSYWVDRSPPGPSSDSFKDQY
jgi:hypothetical protein